MYCNIFLLPQVRHGTIPVAAMRIVDQFKRRVKSQTYYLYGAMKGL